MPQKLSQKRVTHFLSANERWLMGQVKSLPQGTEINQQNAAFPVLGIEHQLHWLDKLRGHVYTEANHIFVPGPDNAGRARRLKGWLKNRLQDHLEERCARYAERLGVSYKRIQLREQRSRWGSCSHQGGLSFNWRLVFAPVEIVDYVAAHEVAHLQEMNHSPAFWALVAQCCPEWKAHRKWLKKNGCALYAYII